MPDVIAQSGARLVEVGTTNRTRLRRLRARARAGHGRDPARAPVELPHASASSRRSRSRSCASSGVPVIDDVGSGVAGRRACASCADEPPVRRSVRGRRGARLLLRRQAARRAAGRPDGRHADGDRPLPRASARAGAADRQALARRARGDAAALPRPGARRGARSRCCAMLDARTSRAAARAPSGCAAAIGAPAPRSCAARPRRSAAARCRCSSCPARWCAVDPAALGADELARSAARRRPAGDRAAIADGRLLLDPRTLDRRRGRGRRGGVGAALR